VTFQRISFNVRIEYEGQITHTPTIGSSQIVTEENVFLFTGKLDNGHYYNLWPVIENETLRFFDEVCL
jgi:hypothetical protein